MKTKENLKASSKKESGSFTQFDQRAGCVGVIIAQLSNSNWLVAVNVAKIRVSKER